VLVAVVGGGQVVTRGAHAGRPHRPVNRVQLRALELLGQGTSVVPLVAPRTGHYRSAGSLVGPALLT